MAPLGIPRRVHVISLLGIALLISGLVFPWIIVTMYGPPTRMILVRLGVYLVSLTTVPLSETLALPFSGLDSLFISLPFLIGIGVWTSLAGLFGKGKRVFFVLYLVFGFIGLLAFLWSSYLSYCAFYCGAPTTGPWAFHGTKVPGPGFWLTLSGFFVSLGASFVQNKMFRRPATRSQHPIDTGE